MPAAVAITMIFPASLLPCATPVCFAVPTSITSWKLQEHWGIAIMPEQQGFGLGLDLVFLSAYGNLGVVRINTKILPAKLKKNPNTHTHKMRAH